MPCPGIMLASLGLGLNLVWCTLMGHTLGFFSSASGIDSWANPRLFFLAGILAFSLAYIAIPRALKHADATLRFILPLAAAFGTGCFGMSYHQTFFDPVFMAIGGLFVSGACYFWLVARYNLMLARTQGFITIVLCISGGLIIKLPLLLCLSALVGPETQMLIAMAVPIASALAFEASCAKVRKFSQAEEAANGSAGSDSRTVFGIPIKQHESGKAPEADRRSVFVLLGVSAVVLAVIRSVSFLGMWGDTNATISTDIPWLSGFLIPAACVMAFAYFALIALAGYSLSTRFQPALLLILFGLLVVAVQASPDGATLTMLTSVIQIDELFAHLLFWVIAITALDVLDIPSYRVIGLAGALYAGVSIAWVILLSKAPIIITLITMLATYALVIVSLYVISTLRRDKQSFDEKRSLSNSEKNPSNQKEEADLTQTVTDTCMDMAKKYGLSPRETEVFILLAQGRTRSFIQEELVLSGSTVKTHVTHIYTKMNVHDRQEMIDLIWN
ncbi:LuxR family transcriptional regulator [Paraeggerthella hongkongensis]|uniref:LuxR family transcriptional regulator n=2 Tax=Paraeggerthella hongkongensis TaxID=230658 RepID=A0A3N0BGT9_9ACTN|nr:LuxR family transcriptional regulator [Paraeggerthella hongkongensis]